MRAGSWPRTPTSRLSSPLPPKSWCEATKQEVRDATGSALRIQRLSTQAITGLVALSLLTSILIVWRYVGRNIVRRLNLLSGAMFAIAGGGRETAVPVTGSDEIAAMGRSRRGVPSERDRTRRVAGRARRGGGASGTAGRGAHRRTGAAAGGTARHLRQHGRRCRQVRRGAAAGCLEPQFRENPRPAGLVSSRAANLCRYSPLSRRAGRVRLGRSQRRRCAALPRTPAINGRPSGRGPTGGCWKSATTRCRAADLW